MAEPPTSSQTSPEQATAAHPAEVPPGLTYQLRFEQFKQIATLAVAAAGGVLVLLQAGYVEASFRSGAVVGAFALAATLSLFGQDKLVEGLEQGRGWPRSSRLYLMFSFALIGAGAAVLIDIIL